MYHDDCVYLQLYSNTIKGYGPWPCMLQGKESKLMNQRKKLGAENVRGFRDKINIPIPDDNR